MESDEEGQFSVHCAGGNMGQSSQWTRLVCYRGEREEGQFGVEEAIWGSLASAGGNMGQSSQWRRQYGAV